MTPFCIDNEGVFKYTLNYFFLGHCLYLKGKGPYFNSHSCTDFIQGCPNTSFQSIKIYERKCCNSLMLHPLLKFKYINRKDIPLNDDVCLNNS